MINFDMTVTPQAIGIWTFVGGGVAWLVGQWRINSKLSDDDRLAKHMGFQSQTESLWKENRMLRAELAVMGQRFDDLRDHCNAETEQLRNHVVRLEDELVGCKREQAQWRASSARLEADRLPFMPPPEPPK